MWCLTVLLSVELVELLLEYLCRVLFFSADLTDDLIESKLLSEPSLTFLWALLITRL